MRKKLFYLLIIFISLFGLFYFYYSLNEKSEDGCAFCNQIILNRQMFYEDDLVLALYTHKPILPSHCLIMPKRHVERFEMLTDQEIVQIGKVIKKVNQAASKVFNTNAYLILQKNGAEVGQTVPHVHFHYIARPEGDNSPLKFMIKMYLTNFQQPLSVPEIDERVKKLKEAMTSLEN